jgi:cytochrome b561
MTWKNTPAGFGAPAIVLHWLTLLLIVAAYATMEFKSLTPRGSPGRALLAAWNYGIGLSVFALVWLRLTNRAVGATPAIVPPPAVWEARLAALVHAALYALMIALPLLGWLTVSARGDPVALLGAALPALVGPDKAQARWFKNLHETLGTIGYVLIGLHAVAALFHHYVRRDNTLRLMWRKQRPASSDRFGR